MFGFGFLWWSIRWGLATVFFICVMAVAGYYVFNEAVANQAAGLAGSEYVIVPNITNQSATQAERVLREKGLGFRQSDDPVDSDEIPANMVVYQRPEPGATVKAGRSIVVTLSRGPRTARVPNVVSLTEEEARQQIASRQFQVGESISRIASKEPRGKVLGQYPPPDRQAPPGAKIFLLVSRGDPSVPTYIVPTLTGLSEEEARETLQKLGLRMEVLEDRNPDARQDVVLSQTPEAGSEVTPGASVTVNIKPSPSKPVAGIGRRVTLRYTVPPGFMDREVTVVEVFSDGTYGSPLFPKPDDYVNGLPPKVPPGWDVVSTFIYKEEATIEVRLDGRKVRTYHYIGDAAPVITDFAEGGGPGGI